MVFCRPAAAARMTICRRRLLRLLRPNSRLKLKILIQSNESSAAPSSPSDDSSVVVVKVSDIPKPATVNVFVPFTEEMNKGFLGLDDTGLTSYCSGFCVPTVINSTGYAFQFYETNQIQNATDLKYSVGVRMVYDENNEPPGDAVIAFTYQSSVSTGEEMLEFVIGNKIIIRSELGGKDIFAVKQSKKLNILPFTTFNFHIKYSTNKLDVSVTSIGWNELKYSLVGNFSHFNYIAFASWKALTYFQLPCA